MLKTGFVGLGAMGLPMAENLHRKGLLAAVWNRSTDKAAAVSQETGCRHCSTLEELAGICDVLVMCVTADQDVLDIVRAVAP